MVIILARDQSVEVVVAASIILYTPPVSSSRSLLLRIAAAGALIIALSPATPRQLLRLLLTGASPASLNGTAENKGLG